MRRANWTRGSTRACVRALQSYPDKEERGFPALRAHRSKCTGTTVAILGQTQAEYTCISNRPVWDVSPPEFVRGEEPSAWARARLASCAAAAAVESDTLFASAVGKAAAYVHTANAALRLRASIAAGASTPSEASAPYLPPRARPASSQLSSRRGCINDDSEVRPRHAQKECGEK